MSRGGAGGEPPECAGGGGLGPRGTFLRTQAWLAPMDSVPEEGVLFKGWASFHVHAREQYCSVAPGEVAGAASTGALHVALPQHGGGPGDAGDVWALGVEVYGGRVVGPDAREVLEAGGSGGEGTGPVLVLDGQPYAVDWGLMSGAVSGTLADFEAPVAGGAQKEKRKRKRGKRRGGRGAGTGADAGASAGGRDVNCRTGVELLKGGDVPSEMANHYVTLLFPHVCLNLFCRTAGGGAGRDLWRLQVEGLEKVLKETIACKEKMAGAATAGGRTPGFSFPEADGDLECDPGEAAGQAPDLFDAWMQLLDSMCNVEPEMPLQDVWGLISSAAELRRRAETQRSRTRADEAGSQEKVHRATQIILGNGPDHPGSPEESLGLLEKALERQFQTQTNELHCALAGL